MLRNPEKANEERSLMLDDQVFVRSRSVVSRVVAGETLIVPVRGKVGDLASIYSFNETGSLIWKLLDTPRRFIDLVSAVADAYDADVARVREDVIRFLGEMQSASLVEMSASEFSASEISAVRRAATANGSDADCLAKNSSDEFFASESFLAEVPETAMVAGTEGPVGREGLTAADAN